MSLGSSISLELLPLLFFDNVILPLAVNKISLNILIQTIASCIVNFSVLHFMREDDLFLDESLVFSSSK